MLLIWKDPDAGKDWGQEEKGMTEDETVGWHRWLDGHEFEQTPGDGEEQGSLVLCSPWGLKESDTTERVNNDNATSEGYLQRTEILPDFSDLDKHTHFFLMLYLILIFFMVKCTTQLYPVK